MHSTILEAPLEVEELVKLGSKWSICPYYATRSTQARADVVLMPYSTLLSEDVREVRARGRHPHWPPRRIPH